jgi:putative membrane protein
MTLQWIVAFSHLLALGIGMGAVWARGRALRGTLDDAGLKNVFYADNWYGIAALIWIVTGVWRAFGGLEKGTDYYLHSMPFLIKMGLYVLLAALETWPMIVLIKWRLRLEKGETIDTGKARLFALFSEMETIGLIGLVMAATAMSRGVGFIGQ